MTNTRRKPKKFKAWAVYNEDGVIWGRLVRLPIFIKRSELLTKCISRTMMKMNHPKLSLVQVEIKPVKQGKRK